MRRPSFRPIAARLAVAAAALLLTVALPGTATLLLDSGPPGGVAATPAASETPGSGSAGPSSARPAPSPSPWVPSGQPAASPLPIPSGDSSGAAQPRQVLANVPIPVFTHGPRNQRVVALTFDDGYSPIATANIFAILESEHVAATFFPYAAAVRLAPALWRAIAAAGYPIANHTTNHPDLTTLPAWRVRAELDVARTTIQQITGRPMLDVFRPPYGAWNATVLHEAAAAGCRAAVLWDVDSRDWTGIAASAIAGRAEVGTAGSIVLLHAGPAQTPLALPYIIEWYRAHGYGFVTVPELLAAQLAAPQPSAPPALPSPTPAPSASPAASPSTLAHDAL
ncbi:MAG: polysaccharide deacetylase family protein [Candidatus Limnocylindrales bacterium]